MVVRWSAAMTATTRLILFLPLDHFPDFFNAAWHKRKPGKFGQPTVHLLNIDTAIVKVVDQNRLVCVQVDRPQKRSEVVTKIEQKSLVLRNLLRMVLSCLEILHRDHVDPEMIVNGLDSWFLPSRACHRDKNIGI